MRTIRSFPLPRYEQATMLAAFLPLLRRIALRRAPTCAYMLVPMCWMR